MEIEQIIEKHLDEHYTEATFMDLEHRFKKNGFVMVSDIVGPQITRTVHEEVLRLLDEHAERRDLFLETTANTPRFMSVVRSEFVAAKGRFIRRIYQCAPLLRALGRIAGEPLFPCPSPDEEFLITCQEKKGDTHGWHWGDFSFALIWIVETPPLEVGGMLQCIPHTRWDKSNPRIHEYMCANLIATYGFRSGDIYFLRSDTTLHRTVPLNADARRIILNMTWAARKDLDQSLVGGDRWWENSAVPAAKQAV